MRYYLPTPQEILGSLPLDEQAELLTIIGRAGVEDVAHDAVAGRTWIAVPRPVWDAFTAAVKRGDYDTGWTS